MPIKGKMTPGPWEAVDTGADVWEIVSPKRGCVAEASHHRPECATNARAIAALPELVEAATDFVSTLSAASNLKLRRILARIDGEGE